MNSPEEFLEQFWLSKWPNGVPHGAGRLGPAACRCSSYSPSMAARVRIARAASSSSAMRRASATAISRRR
jgi:hypothetical protein